HTSRTHLYLHSFPTRRSSDLFVAHFGRNVRVQLNSPVTAIHYGADTGGGVVVETATGGKYRGRRVVVTVSTGILAARRIAFHPRSEEHTSELQSRFDLVCRLL